MKFIGWNNIKHWNGENKPGTYCEIRNDDLKVHDCLLPWDKLPDYIKKYDYETVEAIPDILKSVGFAVVKGWAKQ